jgi:hypothetical protein
MQRERERADADRREHRKGNQWNALKTECHGNSRTNWVTEGEFARILNSRSGKCIPKKAHPVYVKKQKKKK